MHVPFCFRLDNLAVALFPLGGIARALPNHFRQPALIPLVSEQAQGRVPE